MTEWVSEWEGEREKQVGTGISTKVLREKRVDYGCLGHRDMIVKKSAYSDMKYSLLTLPFGPFSCYIQYVYSYSHVFD